MRQHKLLAAYIIVIAVTSILPHPESTIIRIVERAGLAMILVRGLKGHYDDFKETLEGKRRH
jgi:hypothetical protein